MKLCPRCGRTFLDETLSYCLDDGTRLVYGPSDENPTLIQSTASDSGSVESRRIEDPTAILSASNASLSGLRGIHFDRRSFILLVIAAVVLIAGSVTYYRSGGSRTGAPNAIHSIAVLPLENLSGDATQEYFADGMTDALITTLSQIKSLRVISRTSIMRYKGSHESLPDIARMLGADAVVEGSVLRSGDRVRVTAQLVPATTDAAVWSQNYERDVSDLLKLQSEVARAIAGEIKAQLTAAESDRFADVKQIGPKAHEEFLLGQFYSQKLTEADLATAIDHFTRATEIEPTYAEAYAGLARAWLERGVWGGRKYAEVEIPGRAAAVKALSLDPDLSMAHVSMCYLNTNYDYDWQAAETHAKRAIELDPSNSKAYLVYGWYLLTFGRFDELKQAMTTAQQLDPVSAVIQSDFGRMLYRAKLFDEAEMHLKRSIELDGNNPSAYGRLADVYMETGRFDEALAEEDKASAVSSGPSYELRRALIYAKMGNRQKALELWKGAGRAGPGDVARLHVIFGEFDEAFAVLNKGLDERQGILPHIRVDPGLEPLHADPRWAKLLARLNLPPS